MSPFENKIVPPVIDITAADIDTSGVAVEIVLPVEWLERELGDANATAVGEGSVNVRLSRSGRADIVAHGRAKAVVEVPCARCLKPATIELSTDLSLLLAPKAPAPKATASPAKLAAEARRSERTATRARADKTEDYEFTSEEADKDEYDGERVILDPFVREALLLELPSFPLCEEGCQGLVGGELPKPPDFERKNPFAVLKDWSPDGPEVRAEDPTREGPKVGKRVILGSSHLQKAPPGKKRSQKRAQAASKVSPAGPRKV